MEIVYSLASVLAVLIWSGNVIATKLSSGLIEPGVMTFYRWLIAVVVMSPFVLPAVIRDARRFLPLLPKCCVLGLLGMVMYQGLAYFAAKTTSATNMGILTSLIPLVTILLSTLVLKETPSWGVVMGGVVSISGLIFLMSQGDPVILVRRGINVGDGLMLLASASYALYGVLLKKWNSQATRWQALYLQALCAVLLLFPVFLVSPSSPLNSQSLPIVIYAGVVASVAAPFFWILGVERLGPNRASIFMNLLPLITSFIAVLMLHEPIQNYHMIGCGLTLLGVLIAQTVKTPFSLRIRIPERGLQS